MNVDLSENLGFPRTLQKSRGPVWHTWQCVELHNSPSTATRCRLMANIVPWSYLTTMDEAAELALLVSGSSSP